MNDEKSNANNLKSDRGLLTGMFPDNESTERAYSRLRDRGYTEDEIHLIMSEGTRDKYYKDRDYDEDDNTEVDKERREEVGNKALEGTGAGAAIGGTVGAVAGIIAALGTSVLIPGLGIVIAGPIAAGLAGAGAGGITGGLIGALVGMGIPEDRAKRYESGIKQGKFVMGVRPKNEEDAKYFEDEWRKERAEDIYR